MGNLVQESADNKSKANGVSAHTYIMRVTNKISALPQQRQRGLLCLALANCYIKNICTQCGHIFCFFKKSQKSRFLVKLANF